MQFSIQYNLTITLTITLQCYTHTYTHTVAEVMQDDYAGANMHIMNCTDARMIGRSEQVLHTHSAPKHTHSVPTPLPAPVNPLSDIDTRALHPSNSVPNTVPNTAGDSSGVAGSSGIGVVGIGVGGSSVGTGSKGSYLDRGMGGFNYSADQLNRPLTVAELVFDLSVTTVKQCVQTGATYAMNRALGIVVARKTKVQVGAVCLCV